MSVVTKGTVTYSGIKYNLWQRERAIAHQAHIKNVIAVNDDGKTLTANDSGALVTLDSSGGTVAVTLPTHAAGLNFHFVQKGATTNAVTITGATDTLQGVIFANDGSGDADALVITDKTNLLMGTDTVIGDWAKFESDGTNWYVSGQSQVKGVSDGMTVTG